MSSYNTESLTSAFKSIAEHWADSELRVAVWNAAQIYLKPFLDTSDEELSEAVNTNFQAPFKFSRLVLAAFKNNELDEHGKRGCLIFTGATSAIRGNANLSAFCGSKFALRGLSQSLNKEFGINNIHVRSQFICGIGIGLTLIHR